MTRSGSWQLGIAGILVTATGCGFSEADAHKALAQAGPTTIRRAAETLSAMKGSPEREIPSDVWPEALRELKPEAITVDESGVKLWMFRFYVQGEGLYVIFEDGREPGERCCDPSFKRIEDRIYWFQYTG